jgi:hypothetical protein
MKIICENVRNETIEFYRSPLWINSVEGIGADYEVITSKNSGQDGENYNGSTAQKRNIVVVLDMKRADYVAQRNRLYTFFQPDTTGIFYYYDTNESKKINYKVEKVTPTGGDGPIKHITLSLICPDPKFYALDEEITQLAAWQDNIEFPFDIVEDFELTTKVNTLIGNVYNESNVVQGLTIKFTATGTVVNPSLYDVNRQKMMKIVTTMVSGDLITVTTANGNKRVTLTRGGVTTNINNQMLYPPVWLQAQQGDNLYRYDAESGIDSLSVSILHTQAYWGA